MLRGHTKQLLALDWSPNGTALASGSDDNSSCIWDVRQQRMLYTLPAHSSLISRVRWAPVTGEYLLTASYDGTIKAWSGRDFSPLGTLTGHDGKVTGLDIYGGGVGLGRWPLSDGGAEGSGLPDEVHVVSVGFDRTFKTWAHELEF
jgi:U4/U6 small nuclear ribonucleoprotein PRP4